MSIRTFYNFFASKDDLLVAVHETILATELVPPQEASDAETTPSGVFGLTFRECTISHRGRFLGAASTDYVSQPVGRNSA